MAPTWSSEESAPKEIQIICDTIKSLMETDAEAVYSVFTARKFIYQVPENIDYIIKVQIGTTKCVHLKVTQDLPFRGGKVTYVTYKSPKYETEALSDFSI